MSVPQRSKSITEILTDATPNWTPAVDDSRLARVEETAIIYYFNKSNVWVRLDLSASSLGYNIVSNIADFNALIAGSTAGTWVIIGDVVLDANKAMPVGVTLEFTGGEISGAFTVTGNNTGLSANLVQIFDSTVTLAGTWNVKEFYPQWFGAVADGTTDDAPAIQKAIDNPDVKPVFIPKGDYMISSTLSIPSNSEITNNGTILRDTGVATFDMLEGDSVDNVIIRGGKIDGVTLEAVATAANRFCGIRFWDSVGSLPCTNILVQNVEVTNTTSAEAQTEGNRGAITMENTVNGVVDGCKVYNNRGSSVLMHGPDSKDCKVINCYLYDNDELGSAITGNAHTGLLVDNNHCYNTMYTPISVNGNGAIISNNIVYNGPDTQGGITIGHNNTNPGDPSNASNTICIGNIIRDCGTTSMVAGIVCSNSNNVLIANNHIKDNKGRGIYLVGDPITQTGECKIVNNVIDSNLTNGILIEWGEDHVIEGNTIINNGSTAIYIDGAKDYTLLNRTYIKNNFIKDNGGATASGITCVQGTVAKEVFVHDNMFYTNGTNQGRGITSSGSLMTVHVKDNDFNDTYTDSNAYYIAASGVFDYRITHIHPTDYTYGIGTSDANNAANSISSGDSDNIIESGLYALGGSVTNKPVAGGGHFIVNNNQSSVNDSYLSQSFIPYAGNEIYFRTKNGGTYGAWKKLQPYISYTVSTLPTGAQGDIAYVTDALTPTYLGTAVGGGAVVCKVFHDGTNWIT